MIWFVVIGIILLIIFLAPKTREANNSILSSGSSLEPAPERTYSVPVVVDTGRIQTDNLISNNSVLGLDTPLLKPVLEIPDPNDPDYYSKLNDYKLQELLKT